MMPAGCARQRENPMILTMPKYKWRQSESITLTVTLNPPPEIRCLIPTIDARMFQVRVFDDRGKLDPTIMTDGAPSAPPTWWNLLPVKRDFVTSLTFTVPLDQASAPPYFLPYRLQPGRYRVVAVYDAREIRKTLEKDPVEPLATALARTCGILDRGSPFADVGEGFGWRSADSWVKTELCGDQKARTSADPLFPACWTSFKALLERIGCPPREGTFFEGPYESNVVEFKVVPGKRKDAEDGS